MGWRGLKRGLNGSACRGNGQVTLLAPAASVSIAVMYCQIIVTFLSLMRMEPDLGVESREGSQCFGGVYGAFFKFHPANITMEFADN